MPSPPPPPAPPPAVLPLGLADDAIHVVHDAARCALRGGLRTAALFALARRCARPHRRALSTWSPL
eukprot:2972941-Prymnesium_polylepis.1